MCLQERAAGSIKGSVHVPSGVFQTGDKAVDGIIAQHKLDAASEIAVHCHFCHAGKRGPTAARVLSERFQKAGKKVDVKVLTGGIVSFMELYAKDSKLVDVPPGGWDPKPKH